MTPIAYAKCTCGAITIFTDIGDYSCQQKNLKKFFPDIDLRKLARYEEFYSCNHCVNHYGLDLCGCGSGEEFGKCKNDLEECSKPMQKLGEYTFILGKDAWK